MLENLNLKHKLSREEYKRALPALQRRLYDLERVCWQRGVSSIIIFEGWDAAGKGGAISALTERLDPRGFRLHPINAPRTFEQQRPWLWRFWLKIPGAGEMAIFDRMLAADGAVILKFFLHISKKEQKQRFEAMEKDPLERWRVTKGDWERHK